MNDEVDFEEIAALAERGLKLWKESPLHVRQREQCKIMGALSKAWLALKKEVEDGNDKLRESET